MTELQPLHETSEEYDKETDDAVTIRRLSSATNGTYGKLE